MGSSKHDQPVNLDHLINRHITLSDLRRHMTGSEEGSAGRELEAAKEGPWITFSREIGSGGTELAKRIAQRLGWPVFDREILAAIARHDPSRERVLSRLDEHAVGFLEDFLNNLLDPEAVSRSLYAREVSRLVWTLARHGQVVLVGRGANWLLDSRCGLRVRVVAPLAMRTANVARGRGLDKLPAEAVVRREDAELAAFVRQLFRKDVEDPLGYDLILNLGQRSEEAAAEVIEAALRGKLGRPAGS